MPLALIHDWLNQIGGAEDVLETLVEMFPDAPIYTSMYWREKMPAHWRRWNIKTSFMDSLPLVHRFHQPYLFVYPFAFQNFDLTAYDIILSNKSGFCHGITKPKKAIHICYCLTPTRYVWGFDDYASREGFGQLQRNIIRPSLDLLRRWDKAAASRVDHFIAISSDVQRRIARYYERESVIIYPPVNTERFNISDQVEDYFLCLGRLIPYKRVDLAVQACTQLRLPLIVAGDGRDRARLERMAGDTIKFVGRVSDEEAARLMSRCRAFIFPGLEDFGIAPVQAMAAGRPVIAYAGGGAIDTVIENKTGHLFHQQTVGALVNVLKNFDATRFNPNEIHNFALKFDKKVFQEQLTNFIGSKIHPS
ncbi:MAG: glycosyltransferase [Chloroflexota bacterium]